jgi:hypothetical protein
MKVKTTDGVYRKNPQLEELHDIISEIKTEKNMISVTKIRASNNDVDIKLIKKGMKMFEVLIDYTDENRLKSNGIVYFDIDKKDNIGVDFQSLRDSIALNPKTKFCFISPSGGMKIGIQTDFIQDVNDITKANYKKCYDFVHDWLLKEFKFQHDKAVRVLTTTCFTSYDPDAFWNDNPEVYQVLNDVLSLEETQSIVTSYNPNVSHDYAEKLFLSVPSNASYNDRLIANYMILHYSSHNAYELMLSHWDKSADTLKKNIRTQKQNSRFGNIESVKKIIIESGGKVPPSDGFTGGAKRMMMVAEKSSHKFSSLLSVEDAQQQLEKCISRFFEEKTSMCLKVSSGFGKTETIFKYIAKYAQDNKILFLSPTHKLLTEGEKRLNEIARKEGISDYWLIAPTHISGKSSNYAEQNNICLNTENKKKYLQENVPIPQSACKKCLFYGECDYAQQFNNVSSLRFAATVSIFNKQSIWENGSTENYGRYVPKSKDWTPNFIIVDESIVQILNHKVNSSAGSPAIRQIILDIDAKISLIDSIKNNSEQIITDYNSMANTKKKLSFTTDDTYIHEYNKFEPAEYAILEAFRRVIASNYDVLELHGFNNSKGMNEKTNLSFSELQRISAHYRNIPMLVLDATANEMVMREIYPNNEFHDISIQPSGKIDIYQCQNATFSKHFLDNNENIQALIKQIKEIIISNKPKNIGLITYMNLGERKNFDAYLAKALNFENIIFRHFMDLRGTNEFEDVDLMFVVGRHQLSYQDTIGNTEAIFQTVFKQEYKALPVPVKMSDGTSMTLSNKVFVDERVQATSDQFCRSETIQAIGRSRFFYGSQKKVYFFSNEALGSEVSINSFFDFDHPQTPPFWAKMQEIGYVRTEKRFMIELGFSKRNLELEDRVGIIANFISRGCELHEINVTTKQYKKEVHEYLVYDQKRFELFINNDNNKRPTLIAATNCLKESYLNL